MLVLSPSISHKVGAHMPILLSLDMMIFTSLRDILSSVPPLNPIATPASSGIPEREKIVPNYWFRPGSSSGINLVPSEEELVEPKSVTHKYNTKLVFLLQLSMVVENAVGIGFLP